MPTPPFDQNASGDVVFDVTKPSEGIRFLGLLDRSDTPGNKLTGLFDWQCRQCGALNRDAAIVEPQAAFLSRWLCSSCEEATIVRFQARGSAEWVAEHTLAITGKAFCHLAEDELACEAATVEDQGCGRGNQRLFAWIAVPLLLALVALGLSDMQRLSDSSAAPVRDGQTELQITASSRLLGQWVSEDGEDSLHFGHIDTEARKGRYVHFSGDRRPGQRVWFDIIYEDSRGEQLVIRQWAEPSDKGRRGGYVAETGEATVYIPRHGRSLTWIDIQDGTPTVHVYRRVSESPAGTIVPMGNS